MNIAAIVLAAGLSKRMGLPKLSLPWGDSTVIGHVCSVLSQAGVTEIVIVTGGARQQVETALAGEPVRLVFNPRFEQSEMIDSLQVGLVNLSPHIEATLVALGDQPQIQVEVVQGVMQAYQERRAGLVVPSYRMKRGHPWLVDRALWDEILSLHPPYTLRDFLARFEQHISYLPVESDTILKDLDTPDDYEREKNRFSHNA